MAPPFSPLWFLDEGIDVVGAAVIVLASLFIFFRTRELYELSSHPGIKYFRYAFLFFGISFFMQLLRPLFHFFEFGRFSLRWHTLFIVVYVGTMAVLCLLYSVVWRRVRLQHPFLVLTALSLLVAFLTLLGRPIAPLTLLLQAVLFLIVLVISYHDAREHRRSKALQVHVLYTLLFFSWIANVIANQAERHFIEASIVLNIISVGLFVVLAYRVFRTTDVAK
jgi:hypothetical protein